MDGRLHEMKSLSGGIEASWPEVLEEVSAVV